MQMQAQIQQWGNGLGLRVSGILRDLPHFQKNEVVQIDVTERGFSVIKQPPKQKPQLRYTEAQLLAGITPHKIHADALTKPLPGEWA